MMYVYISKGMKKKEKRTYQQKKNVDAMCWWLWWSRLDVLDVSWCDGGDGQTVVVMSAL